jgi:hypothetical protein
LAAHRARARLVRTPPAPARRRPRRCAAARRRWDHDGTRPAARGCRSGRPRPRGLAPRSDDERRRGSSTTRG